MKKVCNVVTVVLVLGAVFFGTIYEVRDAKQHPATTVMASGGDPVPICPSGGCKQ